MSPTKATKKPSASAPSAAEKRVVDKRALNKGAPFGGGNKAAALSAPGNKSSADASASKSAPKPLRAAAVAKPAPVESNSSAPPPEADGKSEPKREKAPSAIQTLAQELIAANDAQAVLRHAVALEDERETAANHAARLMQELAELKPELLVPLIERFARLVANKNKRVVTTSASALAPLSRIAPAKVAKQLPVLTQNWEHTTEEGKDGLVRTFAGLCTASVA